MKMRTVKSKLRRMRSRVAISLSKQLRLTVIYSSLFITVFACLLSALMFWELRNHRNEQTAEFIEAGRAFYNQMLVENIWFGRKGGVYVNETGKKQEGTDTSFYKQLRKVDYDTVAGEMAAIASSTNTYRFRIITYSEDHQGGLPDWTVGGLNELKNGKRESYVLTDGADGRFFHYLRPLSQDKSPESGVGGTPLPEKIAVITIPAALSDAVHSAKVKRILVSFLVIGLAAVLFIVATVMKFSGRIIADIDIEIEQGKLKAAMALAGATAHELRQPLAVLIGYSEILKNKISKGEYPRQELEIFRDECFRMNEIITKMLNITRYRLKHYIPGVEIFDIDSRNIEHGNN